MIKYECVYKNDRVGYLEADEPIGDREIKCRFMPYRSKAHLILVELVRGDKKPHAKVKSEKHSIEAVIIDLSSDSITLRARQLPKIITFIKKLVPFK